MSTNWLQQFLNDAVERKLCTSVRCTTCGARDFRQRIERAWTSNAGSDEGDPLGLKKLKVLLAALARVEPRRSGDRGFEEAVRLLLFETWRGHPVLHGEIEDDLKGSWAGELLRRMQEHEAAVQEERRIRREYEDPANVQRRREENKRVRQERHRLRLEAKKERDRLWREKNGPQA